MNNRLIVIVLSVFIVAAPAVMKVYAYRPSPNPFARCQDFLSTLSDYAAQKSASEKSFPPAFLRYASDTGEIPMEVMVEQALIRDLSAIPYWQHSCRYAVAPWAFPGSRGSEGSSVDIYCTRHGFLKDVYGLSDRNVDAGDIRTYFSGKCRENSIKAAEWQQTIDAFDPDPSNIGSFSLRKRTFLRLYGIIGKWGILLVQAVLAVLGGVLFFRGYSNCWIGLTAGAALWIGLQGIYLFTFSTIMLDAWDGRYIRFPDDLVLMLQLSHLILLVFCLVMIPAFRAAKQPLAPLVGLIFGTVISVLFINVISSILGIWAFGAISGRGHTVKTFPVTDGIVLNNRQQSERES